MTSCHDMKKGEIYWCENCGLELQVVKECDEADTPAGECECHSEEGEPCTFSCCGQALAKKS